MINVTYKIRRTYFYYYCFICWPSRNQSFWIIVRSFVLKDCSSKFILAGPIDGPVSIKVVFFVCVPYRDVRGRNVHFRNTNATSSSRNSDQWIVFCNKEKERYNIIVCLYIYIHLFSYNCCMFLYVGVFVCTRNKYCILRHHRLHRKR